MATVPKLDLSSISVPGMQLQATARKRNYFRAPHKTDGRAGPPTVEHDIVTNARASLSQRGPAAPPNFVSNHMMSFRPPATARPSKPVSARAKWIAEDRNVLRFFLFFKEAVHESPQEHFRVRKCVLLYYQADDTVMINETKTDNSGMPQGNFLNKIAVSDLTAPDGMSPLSVSDLVIGTDLPVYGRVFRIVDCDARTRKWFATELGQEQPPPQPYPLDPVTEMQARRAAEKDNKVDSIAGVKTKDNLKQFLMFDQQVLRFGCLWDDSESLYGEKRYFNLHYFLSDDTMELRERYLANCGRDNWPQFLGRRVNCMKPDGSGPYKPTDLMCGSVIVCSGREFQLLKCDDFTREFYAKLGIEQVEVPVKKERKPVPKLQLPPYNGFGTEEDSLNSFYNLIPKKPKRNLKKLQEMADMVLRLKVKFADAGPADVNRDFVMAFFLADDTLGIFEPKKRNSGFMGGKFLERGKHINPATGKFFVPSDLKEAVIAAATKAEKLLTITVVQRTFTILKADNFTMEYFDQKVEKEALSRVEVLFRKLVNVLLMRRFNIRRMFKDLDVDNSKSISREEFVVLLNDRLDLQFDDEDIDLLLSKFSYGQNEIWYNDFCDILSTKWSPEREESKDRIDMLEAQLVNKLRDGKTHLRKTFRRFDEDSNGKLTFSEFQAMCQAFAFQLTPYEFASLMARYDADRAGTIDYNEFCDKVYECDFTSALDGGKVMVTEGGQEKEFDVEEYLKMVKAEEEKIAAATKVDNAMTAFAESFANRKFQLRKTFRLFDKTGDGKINMEEFFDACETVHSLDDNLKYLLSEKFFPNGDEELDYDTFIKMVSKVGQREGNALSGLSESEYAMAAKHGEML